MFTIQNTLTDAGYLGVNHHTCNTLYITFDYEKYENRQCTTDKK